MTFRVQRANLEKGESGYQVIKMLVFVKVTDGKRPIGRPKLRYKLQKKKHLKFGDLVDNWEVVI